MNKFCALISGAGVGYAIQENIPIIPGTLLFLGGVMFGVAVCQYIADWPSK